MKKSTLQITIIGCLLLIQSIAYSQVDTTSILYTCNLHILFDQNIGVINNTTLCSNTEATKKFKFLNFKSFKNIIFIAIYKDKLSLNAIDKLDTLIKDNSKPFCCYYILAYNYNQNKIYHLKGFKTNDFKDFYCYEIPNYLKRKNNAYNRLISEETLNTDYFIEDIDINCLYSTIILKKSNNSKCLISCEERDGNYSISK
jgi:hypothetical protein